MADSRIRVTVGVRWWFLPYVYVLAFFCYLTGGTPSWERVEATIKRAIYCHVRPRGWHVEDGIVMWGRLSIGWNFHGSRTVKSFGLAISFTPDRLLLLIGPFQLVWLIGNG